MHIPVLQKEVTHYLNPKPNENFIDCTIGEAGHTAVILEKNGPKGKILGIETDPELYQRLKEQCLTWDTKQGLVLENDSYVNLKEIVKKQKIKPVQGILFDLGMSSWHLEESGRGFSFLKNESLDMRYNSASPLTAEKIVNYWSKFDLEKILKEYGEEKFAKRIAQKIVEERRLRPIKNTFQLKEIISKVVPGQYRRQKIHFATRTFQALRITVNNELNNLKIALPQALDILEPGGKLAVISFHSLEDRMVKNFFKELAGYCSMSASHSSRRCAFASQKLACLKILTKKPITPSKEEIRVNPRSRSAKLRIAIKESQNYEDKVKT